MDDHAVLFLLYSNGQIYFLSFLSLNKQCKKKCETKSEIVSLCDYMLCMAFADNLTGKVSAMICLFVLDEEIKLHSNIRKMVVRCCRHIERFVCCCFFFFYFDINILTVRQKVLLNAHIFEALDKMK